MRKFYRAYFAVALLLGFHRHVYRVSNRWGENPSKVSGDQRWAVFYYFRKQYAWYA